FAKHAVERYEKEKASRSDRGTSRASSRHSLKRHSTPVEEVIIHKTEEPSPYVKHSPTGISEIDSRPSLRIVPPSSPSTKPLKLDNFGAGLRSPYGIIG